MDNTSPDSGDGLRHKQRPPRDFHVLAQFQILGEIKALGHCDVAIGFEKHHGYWTAWLDVSSYEFPKQIQVRLLEVRFNAGAEISNLRKDIQSKLDTGHALNETDGDEPNDGNDDGYKESPPMHEGRIS